MAYILVENFAGGVDRRRPIYAAPPGTLWEAINCHLTRGGDLEKRKSFVDLGTFPEGTFGLAEQGDTLYTFGSIAAPSGLPSTVTYQRLQHPDGYPMDRILSVDLFAGKLYVVARYSAGSIYHFYDGVIVPDWVDGIVRPAMLNNTGIAAHLAALINASASYIATSVGAVITVTAQTAGVPFAVSLFTANKPGGIDDQTLTSAAVTPNTPGVTGVAASFTFQVTAGTGGGAGTVTVITVGGVDVLAGTINWTTSNANTASLIATQINTQTGSTGWAAVASGQAVIITKNATGTVHNNLTVQATTTGTMRFNNLAAGVLLLGSTAGGVDAVAGVAQVNTITVGGTFEVDDRFGITLTSTVSAEEVVDIFGNTGNPAEKGTFIKTHKRKLYSPAGPVVNFSGVNTAVGWNADQDIGAGFITASTNAGGSQDVVACDVYQGFLALFSRRVIQVWDMRDDDTLNDLVQTMKNTGTRSARSIEEYGGMDTFYLSDSGIRSLRARQSSSLAQVTDVGVAIDNLLEEYFQDGASDQQIEDAVSVIDPKDGRFWMAIADRVFVYSFFPDTNVKAWTWYEPGFEVDEFAVAQNLVFARGKDGHLYVYGGTSGYTYDSTRVTILTPFLTAQKDGTYKDLFGFDQAALNAWDITFLIDPNELANVVHLGSNTGVTFSKPDWASVGHSTHVAVRATHEAAGPASISKMAIYYEAAEQSG